MMLALFGTVVIAGIYDEAWLLEVDVIASD